MPRYSTTLPGCRDYSTDEGNGGAAAVFAGRYARRVYGRSRSVVTLREDSRSRDGNSVIYDANIGYFNGDCYSIEAQIWFTVHRA